MLLGGVLGRASGIANPVVAGAVGEGAVMAGSQAEQIRQETVDGRLTADQSLASVGTGAHWVACLAMLVVVLLRKWAYQMLIQPCKQGV
jgi:hypothetical protein